MSETESSPAASVASGNQQPVEFPVPLAVYARSVRPKTVTMTRNGQTVMLKGRPVMSVTPGEPEEIFLKLLKIRHGREKHTPAGWKALIEKYANEPAHPGQPGVM